VIVDVIGPVPSEQTIADAEKDAANRLGWTARSVHDDGSVEDVNAKVEQAIAMHPTIITVSGYPVAALTKPLADAKAAGVVVVMGAQTDTPTGYPGFAATTGGKSAYEMMGRIDAFEFMRTSKCAGAVEVLSLANYPVVASGDSAFKSSVGQYCPQCKITSTSIQAKDIGTAAATGAVVSSLQARPDVDYLRVDIGSMATGLSVALNQAGRNNVTIFGDVPDPAAISALRAHTNAWWVNFGSGLFAYALFDAGLRALGTKQPVVDNGSFPLAVLTAQNVPSEALPIVPANYPDLFAKLWGV
jgi:ABC-type sugar transport system substrate-binding protein